MSDENIVTNLEARFTLDFRCKYCNISRGLFYVRFEM